MWRTYLRSRALMTGVLFAASSTLAACGGAPAGPAAAVGSASLPYAGSPQTAVLRASTTTPIQHVIVMIQENRSFDNFFATYGHDADGARLGKTHTGKIVRLKMANLVDSDIDHSHGAFEAEYDGGKMDGFDRVVYGAQQHGLYPYQFIDPKQVAPLWTLADRYVLADHMFQTQGSGSFTGHQYLIAGGTAVDATHSIVDNPSGNVWGCDAAAGTRTSLLSSSGAYLFGQGPFPCLTYRTIRDLLDAKGVSWKYYTPTVNPPAGGNIWNAFEAIKAVRYDKTEWTNNIVSPETTVFSDISKGTLPSVSWVIPDYWNSDHPGNSHDTGPSWVASLVNAVGASQYWKSTAIVVVWDDWGGFFDNVAPPQLDYNGLGMRVPCLIVSPYAKAGHVTHVRYEFASVLRFMEINWSLGSLGTTDVRANAFGKDVFDFTAAPRAFAPVAAKYSRDYFLTHPPSNEAVDDR